MSLYGELLGRARQSWARYRLDNELEKAATAKTAEGRQSLLFDPYDIVAAMGYRERPTAFNYNTMASMVMRIPVVGTIIQNRTTQVAAFAQRPQHRHDYGLKVMARDPQKKMTAAMKKRASELEDAVLSCGFYEDRRRDRLEAFLKKVVRDSLTYDQMNYEVEWFRGGKPAAFHAVDASSIRVVDYGLMGERDGKLRYVQVYDETPVVEFDSDHMIFEVRNPRSSIRSYGYGLGELEMMVNVLTAIMFGFQHNSRFFVQGTAARGILNIKGSMPPRQLKSFRRAWTALLAGSANSFKTPIVNSEGLEWISMAQNNRDMEFSQFMDFCLRGDAKVRTVEYGDATIESLVGKDVTVLAWDGDTLVQAPATNIRMTHPEGHGKQMVEVRFQDGRTMACTEDHRFMLSDGSWCEAGRLEGKELVEAEGCSPLESVTPIPGHPAVYDLEVPGLHNFVAEGAVVHNCIKLAASIYAIDPMEFNFNYGTTGQRNAMFESPAKSKLTASKDRGLKPLVRFIENSLNENFLQRVDPDFRLKFVGLDKQDASTEADLYSKYVKTFMTVDEVREAYELSPLPDDKGKILLDPTWMQNSMMAGMDEGGEEPGMGPGAGGDEEEVDDEMFDYGGFGDDMDGMIADLGKSIHAELRR